MKINKKHFVFDLDDTLADSYNFNQELFVEVFKSYIDIKNETTNKYLRDLHFKNRGVSMLDLYSIAVKHLSINANPKDLVEANEQLHVKQIHKVKTFRAVEDFIKSLKSDNKIVSIMSNRQTKSLLKILKKNNLDKYVDNIISCSDMGYEKPNPYCLLKLVEDSGGNKEDFIYFGDSKTDYDFAISAGVDPLIVDHYLNQKMFYKMILESFIN